MVATPLAPDATARYQEARPPLRLLPRWRQSVESTSGGARRRQRAPILQLTPRDVTILSDLTRFYGLTVEQVAGRHFGARWTAYHRLSALAAAGLVQLHRPWYRGPGVYLVTAAGASVADAGLPAPRYKPAAMAHHLAVADLAAVLVACQPGGEWTCERELRQAALTTVRERDRGRILAAVPHVPDGLLTVPAAANGPLASSSTAASDHFAPAARAGVAVEHWAVELELTAKAEAEYGRILRWYAAEMAYRRVLWFAATEPVFRRLDRLITRERLDDCMSVRPLPPCVTVYRWGD